MVVLGIEGDVVVVAGHGGSVELVLDVGNVTGGSLVGGNVVGEMVATVVVGHGPTSPPGSRLSRWNVVVVEDGTEVGAPVPPNCVRNGASAWRRKSLAPKLAWMF